MPLDRNHAFADGPVYGQREVRGWRMPWSVARRARRAWKQFEATAVMAPDCRLGPNAWCHNGSGVRERVRLQDGVICRGLLRVETFGQGQISLAAGVYIGDDCLLSSAAGIDLGERVL